MSTTREIESQIWEMANHLRSNMDAGEYRNYILGFVFYRYLSENQEEYLLKGKVVFPENNQSVNDAYLGIPEEELVDALPEIAGGIRLCNCP